MNNNQLLSQIGDLIDQKLQPLKSDMAEVKTDVNTLKKDMAGVKQDVSLLKTDVKALKTDVNTLKKDMAGVKRQLNTVEMKVELVNNNVKKSQEETIEALSDLINSGYDLHEKRIKNLEEILHVPPAS